MLGHGCQLIFVDAQLKTHVSILLANSHELTNASIDLSVFCCMLTRRKMALDSLCSPTFVLSVLLQKDASI